MSQFNKTGMHTYYDQDDDRQAWQESMAYRKKLIQRLNMRGIRVERAHERSIAELEDMFVKDRRRRKKRDGRR